MLHPRRRGYTLFEVVLVCALIIILGAITIPTASKMLGSQKVTAAVDSVRGAWAMARAHAIEEGRPYRFAVVPNTGSYRVAPDDAEFWSGGGSSSAGAGPGGPGGQPLVLHGTLPGGVCFNLGPSPGPLPPEGPGRPVNAPEPPPPSPSAYTSPIVFLPDGTAREDAAITFQARGSRSAVLSLRALTGAVTVKMLGPNGGR